MTHPLARKREISVQRVGGEFLLYDSSEDQAHCLNAAAALVWEHADGLTSVDLLAERLNRELQLPLDRELVLTALEELERAGLLEGGGARTGPAQPAESRLSRRMMIKRLGLAVALVPAVATVLAPTPALAGSVPPGGACQKTSDCQPGSQCRPPPGPGICS